MNDRKQPNKVLFWLSRIVYFFVRIVTYPSIQYLLLGCVVASSFSPVIRFVFFIAIWLVAYDFHNFWKKFWIQFIPMNEKLIDKIAYFVILAVWLALYIIAKLYGPWSIQFMSIA